MLLTKDSDYTKEVKKMVGEAFIKRLRELEEKGMSCLELSILKWTYIVDGGDGISLYGDDCPCCWKFILGGTGTGGCKSCPIGKETGLMECKGSPWEEMSDAIHKHELYHLKHASVFLTPEERAILQPYFVKELEWLKALFNEDHDKCAEMMREVRKNEPKVYVKRTYHVTFTTYETVAIELDSKEHGDLDDWADSDIAELASREHGTGSYEDYDVEFCDEEEYTDEDD